MSKKERASLVVLGSGQGTNFEALATTPSETFKISGVASDRKCPMLEKADRLGIPNFFLSWRDWFDRPPNLSERAPFEKALAEKIRARFGTPDALVLAGYMRLLSPTFLTFFTCPILNVHPADLRVKDNGGKRRYIGANCVYDALMSGETSTCSTVIFVNEEEDGGPIFTLGPKVPYEEGYPVTKEKARRHQEKQKVLSDHPALIEACEKISGEILKSGRKKVCVEYSEP